ncbi:hypothetical protein [Methanocella arvoryzae]|nr:hypothetical protein [Methanocella arvoryzae]
MVDTAGLGAMIVLILLILIALAIILWLLNPKDRHIEAKQVNSTPVPFDDGQFMEAFVKPIYEDGLEHLENAVDSIRSGFDIYDNGAYVEAAEEFISATRSTDEASRKFREVLAMVEDQEAAPIKNARARLTECKQIRQGAKDMETACDAMIAGKKAEAQPLLDGARNLRRLAAEWKKEP